MEEKVINLDQYKIGRNLKIIGIQFLRRKRSLFLLVLSSVVICTVIIHKDVLYNSQLGDDRCHDTFQYEAFYSVKNEIEYCFYRKRDYPYSIKGGVIGVK